MSQPTTALAEIADRILADKVELLDADRVAEILGVSRYYVDTHAKQWPHIRVGRKLSFTWTHVEEIVKLHERRPALEPAVEISESHGQRTRGSRAAS